MGAEMELTSSFFNFNNFQTTYLACSREPFKIESYFYDLVNSDISYKYNNVILHLFNGRDMIGSFKRLDY